MTQGEDFFLTATARTRESQNPASVDDGMYYVSGMPQEK
jgi:hypothetical protein